MNKIKRIFAFASLFSLLFAQNYILKNYVLDDGGTKMTNAGYIARGSFGQVTIGKISNASYNGYIGFWHPYYFPPPVTRDVGVISIISPAGLIPPGSYIPKARVKNFGDEPANFPVYFRIISGSDTIYADMRNITLNSGQEDTVEFNPWDASEGSYTTYCRTALEGDDNPANDVYTGSCLVQTIHDVGIMAILAPLGTISPGPCIPQARVKNFGNTSEAFRIRFVILQGGSEVYSDDTVLPLSAGSSLDVEFAQWNAEVGFYTARCSTYLAGDINPENDTASADFTVQQFEHDVGVVQILSPTGTIPPGSVNPSARVYNYGQNTESFKVYFAIFSAKEPVYLDSAEVTGLPPNEGIDLSFFSWDATPGNYTTKCTTALAGDQNPNNDKRTGSVTVSAPTYGWRLVGDVPLEPDRKKIKSGGGMTQCGNKLYILKGNNTRSMYHYLPGSSLAEFEDTVPAGPSGKKVKKGSGITSDGERYLYILKGANTSEFYRYDTQRGESLWVTLEEVPPGGGKKLKGGTGVCYLPGYIYLLKGSNTNEFYRFNISGGHWEPLASPPRAKGFKDGSCLVAYNNQIYLLGNTYNNFYRYSPDANSWDSLKPMPLYHPQLNRKKKVKEGAAMTVLDNKIYAFKGGNTGEFWMYSPAEDSWYGKDTIPRADERKRVKGGASLATLGGYIWALKGNNTTSIWRYSEGDLLTLPTILEKSVSLDLSQKRFTLRINSPTRMPVNISYTLPEKTSATLMIYNSLGELVYSATSDKGLFTIKELPTGIYLLRFSAKGYRVEKKLIVVK